MARPKRVFKHRAFTPKEVALMSIGDKLNRFESIAIIEYKAIMGMMTDLEAIMALKCMFEESIPMYELEETLQQATK